MDFCLYRTSEEARLDQIYNCANAVRTERDYYFRKGKKAIATELSKLADQIDALREQEPADGGDQCWRARTEGALEMADGIVAEMEAKLRRPQHNGMRKGYLNGRLEVAREIAALMRGGKGA